jgi:hypothetical protein
MFMLMTTVVAVALGLAPVKPDGTVAPSRDNYAAIVGRYSQTIDPGGTKHVRGYDRLTGAPYDVSIDKNGNVEGTVGSWYIKFHVKDAA